MPLCGSATSSPSARECRHGRDGRRGCRCCGGFGGTRAGLAFVRSMGSGSRGVRGRPGEKGLLRTRPDKLNQSDPGTQVPWFGEDDDVIGDLSRSMHVAQSAQSMLLTADQNSIMRLPNFSCFMHHQENLQALLVDIHEDPEGFKEFVEKKAMQTRRKARSDHLGEASVSAAGRESLSDYTNLTEVAQGRFSVVYYAENKRTRRPCAMKRVKLMHFKSAGDKKSSSSSSADQQQQQQPGQRWQGVAAAPSPEGSPASADSPAIPAAPSPHRAAPRGGGGVNGPATSPVAPAAASSEGVWVGAELRLSGVSVGGGGGGNAEEGNRESEGGNWRAGRGGDRQARRKHSGKTAMTYEHCLKEVGLLKNLTSPNIVQLHTWFLDGNALWVVMDWVDGGDLRGVLERTKKAGSRLSELTIWRIFTQICDGLLHMHGERIMHRDLKPDNVLLCCDGTVKLGDLGLGRYLNAQSVVAMSRVGTPLYMSPETLRGRGHGMVSDIWSLGCILYELTMLASPFEGRHLTMKSLFSKIVRADYPPIDSTLYNEHFGNLVAHLLVTDPNLRPKITVVQPAAHLALLRSQQDAAEILHAEQLAAAAAAANAGAGDAPQDLAHGEA